MYGVICILLEVWVIVVLFYAFPLPDGRTSARVKFQLGYAEP